MDESLKNFIKSVPITSLILSYFFFCGALYLIGFWSLFNINIVDFINISDVPKYFIFPFLITNGAFVCLYAIGELILEEDFEHKKALFIERKREDFSAYYLFVLYQFVRLPFIFIYIFIATIYFFEKYQYYPMYWLISSSAICGIISVKLQNKKSIIEMIPLSGLRRFVCFNLIFLPSCSYVLGKIKGLDISNNSKINLVSKYTIDTPSKISDSLSTKYLMSLGDKVIMCTQDNKQILIVNSESLDSLVIRSK